MPRRAMPLRAACVALALAGLWCTAQAVPSAEALQRLSALGIPIPSAGGRFVSGAAPAGGAALATPGPVVVSAGDDGCAVGGDGFNRTVSVVVFDYLGNKDNVKVCARLDKNVSACQYVAMDTLCQALSPSDPDCPKKNQAWDGYWAKDVTLQLKAGKNTISVWVTGSGDAAEAAQEFVVVGKDALPVKMTLGNNDTEVTGKVAVVSFAASPAQGSDVYVSITATDENGDEVNLDILEDINVGKAGGSVAVRLSSFIADGTNVTVEAAYYDDCGAQGKAPLVASFIYRDTSIPDIVINGGSPVPTSNPTVTINNTMPSPGVAKMCISAAPGPCAACVPYANPTAFTLPGSWDGSSRAVYYYEAYANGSLIDPEALLGAVRIDNVAPRITAFYFAKGSTCVNNGTDVHYSINAQDMGGVKNATLGKLGGLSACISFKSKTMPSDCEWMPMMSSSGQLWQLVDNWRTDILPGDSIAYVWVKDAAGNVASSSTPIHLDSALPSGDKYSLLLDEGEVTTYYRWVDVGFKSEPAEGVSTVCIGTEKAKANCSMCVDYTNASACVSTADGSLQYKLPANIAPGTKVTLYAWVTTSCDVATPDNLPLNGSIVVRDAAPSAPTVNIIVFDQTPPKIPTNVVDLDLMLAATDSEADSPIGNVKDMCVRNDANVSACAWKPWADSVKGWLLAAGAGARTVSVWLRDGKGRVSAPGSASVTVDPKSGVAKKADKDQEYTRTNSVDFSVLAVAKEMCFTEATTGPSKCTKWEPYAADKKGFKVSGKQGDHAVNVYFRDTKGGDTWAAAPVKFIFDKMGPKMSAKPMALTPTYAGGKYTLTFANGAVDTVSGVDPEGYIVVLNKAGKTPKSGCVPDGGSAAMNVTYAADFKTGSVTASVPNAADLAKTIFRVCAKDMAGNAATGLVHKAKAPKP